MNVWDAQGVGDIEIFLSIFKQRVTDSFIQNWHARLNDSSHARCYITFASFEHKKYLEVLNVTKYRKSLKSFTLVLS